MKLTAKTVLLLVCLLVSISATAQLSIVANYQVVNYTYDGSCRITSLTGTRTTFQTGSMNWACSGRFYGKVTTKIEFDPGYPPSGYNTSYAVPYATVTQTLGSSGTALGRSLCTNNPITNDRICDASSNVTTAPNQLNCRIDGGTIYCPGWTMTNATTSTGGAAVTTAAVFNPVGAPTSGTTPVKLIPTSGGTQTTWNSTTCVPLVGRITWDIPGQTCFNGICTQKTSSQVVAYKMSGCP